MVGLNHAVDGFQDFFVLGQGIPVVLDMRRLSTAFS